MTKNVLNPVTLLLIAVIFVLSSCSTKKRYTSNHHRSKVKSERSTAYKRSDNKKDRTYTAVSSKRANIVNTAKKYIGKPYVYGGKKPSSGFDCSGFTTHVYKENGLSVSGPSHAQAKQGRKKSMKELKEGDLVFFGSRNKVSHVGIVASVDHNRLQVIHSTSSRGVVVDDISGSDYWQKRYLFGRDILQ